MDNSYENYDVESLKDFYEEDNMRTWPYYPIVMPLKEGQGPATDKECDEITWHVWDRFCNIKSTHKCLSDAVNEAMRLNKELFSG